MALFLRISMFRVSSLFQAFCCLWHSIGALATGQMSKTFTKMQWEGIGREKRWRKLRMVWPSRQRKFQLHPEVRLESLGLQKEKAHPHPPSCSPSLAGKKQSGTDGVMCALSKRERLSGGGRHPTWRALPNKAHLFPPNPCQVSSTLTQCFPSQLSWKAA